MRRATTFIVFMTEPQKAESMPTFTASQPTCGKLSMPIIGRGMARLRFQSQPVVRKPWSTLPMRPAAIARRMSSCWMPLPLNICATASPLIAHRPATGKLPIIFEAIVVEKKNSLVVSPLQSATAAMPPRPPTTSMCAPFSCRVFMYVDCTGAGKGRAYTVAMSPGEWPTSGPYNESSSVGAKCGVWHSFCCGRGIMLGKRFRWVGRLVIWNCSLTL
mmetsp:Transcript_40644/g.34323  ORF Transcript_40644/g.34323 Transcript_40644/m.34323 type:complete len:217 (-) Transcript_40644:478-1128(-)